MRCRVPLRKPVESNCFERGCRMADGRFARLAMKLSQLAFVSDGAYTPPAIDGAG